MYLNYNIWDPFKNLLFLVYEINLFSSYLRDCKAFNRLDIQVV
jgi:hypothetical protein